MQIPRQFNAAWFMVDRHVEAGRDADLAVICGSRRQTYGDVARSVNRSANALRSLGLDWEQRVLLLLLDGPEWIAAFLGTLKLGAVAVPVNLMASADQLSYLLQDSRARLLLVDASLLPQVAAALDRPHFLRAVAVVGADRVDAGHVRWEDAVAAASDECPTAPTTADDIAFWLYSSGTTGAPKGAMHRHRNPAATAEGYGRHVLRLTPEDRTFSVPKLFFAYGLGNSLIHPFSVGASTVLLPARPAADLVLEQVETHRPTVFFNVPTGYRHLLSARSGDFSSVRLCSSAGEPLPTVIHREWRQRYGLSILDGLGTTEALHTFLSNTEGNLRPGSSGKVVPGYEVKVLRDDGSDCEPEELGSLQVRGGSIAAGYWNQSELTQQTYVGPWLVTGDRYRRDIDGFYWYVARGGDIFKVAGMWVAPTEIEDLLAEHPAVAEAAVVGRPDGDGLLKPHAFVVRRSDVSEEALIEFCTPLLPPFKRIRWVTFRDSLPRTTTGKLQRFVLRQDLPS